MGGNVCGWVWVWVYVCVCVGWECVWVGVGMGGYGCVSVVLIKSYMTALSLPCSFHEGMKRFTLVSHPRSLSTSSLPPHFPLSSTQPLTPPHSLLDYPLLASLTNTLIQAFNDLRQCAPLALGPEISQELRRLLESIVHDVGEYHK